MLSKWFITGAGVAQPFILIAKTSGDKRKGLTAFLFDRDQPGWRIVRRVPIMGPEEHGVITSYSIHYTKLYDPSDHHP